MTHSASTEKKKLSRPIRVDFFFVLAISFMLLFVFSISVDLLLYILADFVIEMDGVCGITWLYVILTNFSHIKKVESMIWTAIYM